MLKYFTQTIWNLGRFVAWLWLWATFLASCFADGWLYQQKHGLKKRRQRLERPPDDINPEIWDSWRAGAANEFQGVNPDSETGELMDTGKQMVKVTQPFGAT